jgi:Ca2+-binding RTX toxin-like protein
MIFNDNTVEFSWDGRDYLWILSRVTWDAALQDANNRGGILWSSETSDENIGVSSILETKISEGISTAFLGSQPDGVNYIWLGLNDKDTSGTWNWHSEESLSFTNWASTATPTNNATETVAGIAIVIPDDVTAISKGEWNDFSETDLNTYIIEAAVANVEIEDTSGDDIFTGTIAGDIIAAGIGRDVVNAEAGNDVITLTGNTYHTANFAHNAGSSTQVATNVTISLSGKVKLETVIDGGSNTDTIKLSSGNDAFFLHDSFSGFNSSLILTTDTHTGAQGTQRILNVETINGLDGDDIIDLTSPDYSLAGQVITINGGTGNDVIWGSDATETIIGGDGNDILFGGSGSDTLTGGLGADTFEFTVTAGSDTITDYSKSDGDVLKIYRRDQYEGDKEATISAGVVTFGSVTIDLGDTSLNSLDVLNVEYAII